MAQMDCDSLKFDTREEAKLYCEERLKWRYAVPEWDVMPREELQDQIEQGTFL